MPPEVQALLPVIEQLSRGNWPVVRRSQWVALLRFLREQEARAGQGDPA